MNGKKSYSLLTALIALLLTLSLLLGGCKLKAPDVGGDPNEDIGDVGGGDENGGDESGGSGDGGEELPDAPITLDTIPDWDGENAFVAINGNVPFFEKSDYTTVSFETYAELDSLGRCGVTFACVGKDIMPTDDRGSISSVTPSGWNNNQYGAETVPGGWLYHRCHLIGWQLTGENANKGNLITGTQYINIEGMLPFENMVADYVKETGNHVLYRVTPIFEGYNLVASGVLLEAYSVEDDGEGICFCVYSYNVQPGIYINYYDGSNRIATSDDELGASPDIGENPDTGMGEEQVYVLNISSKKIHKEGCRYETSMNEANRREYTGSIEDLLDQGYTVCKTCNPS